MYRTVGLLKNKMLLLSEADVRRCLVMKDCLDANRKALISVATGQANVPTRIGIPYQAHTGRAHTAQQSQQQEETSKDNNTKLNPQPPSAQDWTLFKPASYEPSDNQDTSSENDHQLLGLKVVSIRSDNHLQGLPLVPATVLSISASTGQVEALVAATYMTAARTAAGSALSTAALLQRPLEHLVIFGAGLQAELHVHAISSALARPIPRLTLINRSRPRAEDLQERLLSAKGAVSAEQKAVRVCESVDIVLLSDRVAVAKSLSTADCIVTTTNTTTPVLDEEEVSAVLPGTHLCSVGSYTPYMQEIAPGMVNRCRVIIDTPEAKSVGDLKHLSANDNDTESKVVFELLGNLLLSKLAGDASPNEVAGKDCTFFKSVGTAIQDVVTADIVVKQARQMGIGTEVDMS